MSDLIRALDIIEYNSKKHRAENVECAPQANFYDHLAQTPEGDRDIPRVGALYSFARFDTELAGSGAAGTPPPEGTLFQGCGLSETVDPSTSVTYAQSATFATTAVDIDVYKGNAYMVSCNNAVGSFWAEFIPNAPVILHWDFAGTYAEPTSGSSGASLETKSTPVVAKGLAYTTVAGNTVVLKHAELHVENTLTSPDEEVQDSLGVVNPDVVDMSIWFQFLIRAQNVATYNWINTLTSETKIPFSIVIGSSAGNICTVTLDGYIRDMIDFGESEGKHNFQIQCQESKASGDNQLAIVYT